MPNYSTFGHPELFGLTTYPDILYSCVCVWRGCLCSNPIYYNHLAISVAGQSTCHQTHCPQVHRWWLWVWMRVFSSSPAPHVSTKLQSFLCAWQPVIHREGIYFYNKMKKYNPQVQKFSNTTNIPTRLKTSMFSPQDDRVGILSLSFLADHTSECDKATNTCIGRKELLQPSVTALWLWALASWPRGGPGSSVRARGVPGGLT